MVRRAIRPTPIFQTNSFPVEDLKMSSRNLYRATLISFAALSLAPLAASAQGAPGPMTQVISAVIKPGMSAKFEEGLKTVEAYIKAQGGTDAISTFVVLDGPQMGSYVTLLPVNWAQRDTPPAYAAELQRQIEKNIVPYQASVVSSLTQVATNLGTLPPASAPPMKYYQVIDLDIRPDRMNDFIAAVAEISAAEHKQNPSTNPVLIYFEVSGGDANRVTVAIGHPTWADFAVAGKSIQQVLREFYGEQAGSSVARQLDSSIAHEENFVVQYRPDLSYVPSGH
jgi:hypothetical protein